MRKSKARRLGLRRVADTASVTYYFYKKLCVFFYITLYILLYCVLCIMLYYIIYIILYDSTWRYS
jgi:hypothetical protein